jgi:hypothetical protein
VTAGRAVRPLARLACRGACACCCCCGRCMLASMRALLPALLRLPASHQPTLAFKMALRPTTHSYPHNTPPQLPAPPCSPAPVGAVAAETEPMMPKQDGPDAGDSSPSLVASNDGGVNGGGMPPLPTMQLVFEAIYWVLVTVAVGNTTPADWANAPETAPGGEGAEDERKWPVPQEWMFLVPLCGGLAMVCAAAASVLRCCCRRPAPQTWLYRVVVLLSAALCCVDIGMHAHAVWWCRGTGEAQSTWFWCAYGGALDEEMLEARGLDRVGERQARQERQRLLERSGLFDEVAQEEETPNARDYGLSNVHTLQLPPPPTPPHQPVPNDRLLQWVAQKCVWATADMRAFRAPACPLRVGREAAALHHPAPCPARHAHRLLGPGCC